MQESHRHVLPVRAYVALVLNCNNFVKLLLRIIKRKKKEKITKKDKEYFIDWEKRDGKD